MSRDVHRRHALALALLATTAVLAGCVARGEFVDPALVEAVAGTQAMDWRPGNFWAYQATFHEETTLDVALVVHRVETHGFHLGSNSSSGFFGLPFTGNVSSSLNPRIGPDEWPLFQFPLEDGKSWNYAMFGYSATTVAHAAFIELPGGETVPGFRFESSAYGKVFARYDYASTTGWFTKLELVEPTDGHRVLDVVLTAYGPDYGQAYYVEEPIRTLTLACSELPGSLPVEIPGGYLRVHALLVTDTKVGVTEARLRDAGGNVLAQARALARGSAMDRASVGDRSGEWRMDHTCAGLGSIYLEISGLSASGPLAPPPADDPEEVDFPRLLAGVVQSTRPARPQAGHATSTGLPVGV